MRTVLRVFYYIFIFPLAYIASIISLVGVQIYRHFEEKKLFRKLCSVKGHLWTHNAVEINGFTKNYRQCLRCYKRQYFRANKGYKDE